MRTHLTVASLFRRHIAVPADHGAWVFLLSPLLVGLFAGGRWTPDTPWLILAALAAFFLRQPLTMLVKAYSGRRPKDDAPAAWFWMAIYGGLALSALSVLLARGMTFLLALAVPAVPVFAWHLWLVSRRAERRQMGVEVVGSGVLALAAPAALWAAHGYSAPGWWLWGLMWFQSAASIVYAYLRLEQRALAEMPTGRRRLQMARRALLYTTVNVLAVSGLSLTGFLAPWLPVPYALLWVEYIWGALNPAIGVKPTAIGLRQLAVSTLFTAAFILAWG